MIFAKHSLMLLLMLAFASCKGISFDPDFYVADSLSQSIVSERGDIIKTSDIRFDQYACMNIEKVKELKKLLMSKNIGPANRSRVFREYTQLVDRISQVQLKQILEDI